MTRIIQRPWATEVEVASGIEFIKEHIPVKKFTEYLGLNSKAQGFFKN